MIDRYCLPEMKAVWEAEFRYKCWLDVEIAACKAMADIGIIPKEDLDEITEKADFDVDKILEIEAVTKHDVIAFLTNVAEYVGPSSRWIHYGLTSSDVLDTATALQLKKSCEILLADLELFLDVLKKRALEFKDVITIGRSHGIHAEPTSFGLKFVLWRSEMERNIDRLKAAYNRICVGQLSGAVGNYAHLSPEIEKKACAYLNLEPIDIATQVIQRDRHAEYLSVLAIIASTLEKIALEIRHLQRTEVLEATENFSKGQKGSSAMPHKKNPIVSEQICGLARLIRSNAHAAMENNALWHERDISHSSVERIILPDSSILVNYMLNKMTRLIADLIVYPDQIHKNLTLTKGLVFSQTLLLKLAQKGMSREDSYALVQKRALECWESRKSFKELVEQEEEIAKYLSPEEFEEIFSYERYLKNVDFIYKRAGI